MALLHLNREHDNEAHVPARWRTCSSWTTTRRSGSWLRRRLSSRVTARNPQLPGRGPWGRVRALRPDLVLLDVALPTMDSPAFLEACRREPSCADVRIVLMTAAWDVERLAKVLGVSGSLPKPFGLHELSRVVEHALAE